MKWVKTCRSSSSFHFIALNMRLKAFLVTPFDNNIVCHHVAFEAFLYFILDKVLTVYFHNKSIVHIFIFLCAAQSHPLGSTLEEMA